MDRDRLVDAADLARDFDLKWDRLLVYPRRIGILPRRRFEKWPLAPADADRGAGPRGPRP